MPAMAGERDDFQAPLVDLGTAALAHGESAAVEAVQRLLDARHLEPGAVLDDRTGMNEGTHFSEGLTMAPTSASAITTPSTMAFASYQPMVMRRRIFLM